MNKFYRILNILVNRISEGLRCIETGILFIDSYEASEIKKKIYEIRHKIRNFFINYDFSFIINQEIYTSTYLNNQLSDQHLHKTIISFIIKNFKRVEENLRCVEDLIKANLKLSRRTDLKNFFKLRFQIYNLEKQCCKQYYKGLLNNRIYAILDRNNSAYNNMLSSAISLLNNNVKIIQYREKNKSIKFIKNEVEKIYSCVRKKYDVIFIINDYYKIAMELGIPFLHLGQNDLKKLSVNQVNNLKNDFLIFGISCETEKQIKYAIKIKADYIGINSCFESETKLDKKKI